MEVAFSFLVENFGYRLETCEDSHGESILVYVGARVIDLVFSRKENEFYFVIVRNSKIQYPDDNNFDDIRTFYDLLDLNPGIGISGDDLQPHKDGYNEALKLNAKLLQESGEILKGEQWFTIN
jgi:hypothetical protein